MAQRFFFVFVLIFGLAVTPVMAQDAGTDEPEAVKTAEEGDKPETVDGEGEEPASEDSQPSIEERIAALEDKLVAIIRRLQAPSADPDDSEPTTISTEPEEVAPPTEAEPEVATSPTESEETTAAAIATVEYLIYRTGVALDRDSQVSACVGNLDEVYFPDSSTKRWKPEPADLSPSFVEVKDNGRQGANLVLRPGAKIEGDVGVMLDGTLFVRAALAEEQLDELDGVFFVSELVTGRRQWIRCEVQRVQVNAAGQIVETAPK